MKRKHEIKTLMQGIYDGPKLNDFDSELAKHLNDGWKIIPSLSSIVDNFSMDGSEGGAYQLRVVTLRRKLPNMEKLKNKAMLNLNTLLCYNYAASSPVGHLRDQWAEGEIGDATFLDTLNNHVPQMSEAVLAEFRKAQHAYTEYQAALALDEGDAS